MRRIAATLVGLLAVAACSSPAAGAVLDRRPSRPTSATATARATVVSRRPGPGRPRRG